MSLLDELLKQAMTAKRTPVQSDVPGGLLALLTQGNQASVPDNSMISMLMNKQAPEIPTTPPPPQFQSSGIGRGIVTSLLGEWFDERKATNDLERADAEKRSQAEELEKIFGSGKQGKELYYELLKARSPVANEIAKKGLEPLDPEKTKVVEVGVEGRPDLRQQAIVDPINKTVTPIGTYWKPSSGVIVNTGEQFMNKPMNAAEATNLVDKSGNPVNPIVGITPAEAKAQELRYGKPPTQAEVKSDVSFDTTTGLLDDIKILRKGGASITGVSGVIQDLRSGNNPISAVANIALNKAGYKIEPKNAELMSKVKNFGNYALQVMRGAQVGPQEQELFQKALPTEGQPDEVFDANMATAKKIFRDAMAKTQQSSGRKNTAPTPNLPPVKSGMVMGDFVYVGPDGDNAAAADPKNWRPK